MKFSSWVKSEFGDDECQLKLFSDRVYSQHSDRIHYIEDGLKNLSFLTYSPLLLTPNYHAENNDYIYPVSSLPGSIWVTTKVEKSNGTNGGYFPPTDYYYYNAKVHRRGKGFLGFEKFVVKDWKNMIHNTTIFDIYTDNDLYYSSYPKISKTELLEDNGEPGKLVTETEVINYTHINNIPSQNLIFIPYTQTSITKTYEINDNNTLKSVEKITTTIDEYGNTLNLLTEHGKSEVSLNFAESTNNLYDNFPDDWVLGRLKSVNVTKNAPGSDQVIRESEFTYYNNASRWFGMLKSEIVEPDDINSTEKTYVYDIYGNITSSTVSAFDPQNPDPPTARTSTTIYGQDYNYRFATSEIDPMGFISSKTYDPVWGKVISATDINGFVTTHQYDDFGRLEKLFFLMKINIWVYEDGLQMEMKMRLKMLYFIPGAKQLGSHSKKYTTTGWVET